MELKSGHTGSYHGNWKGVIRDGRKVIWTCAHSHANRDISSLSAGVSARSCASSVLDLVLHPEHAADIERFWSRRGAVGQFHYQTGAQEAQDRALLNYSKAEAKLLRLKLAKN